MIPSSRFVEDGPAWHLAAMEPEIWAAVEKEYAELIAGASFAKRVWLRWRMRPKVRRRVDAAMSPWALY